MEDGGDNVVDWMRFGLRSVGRHRLLTLLVFALFASATVGSVWVLPPSWKVTSRIHAVPWETSPGAARPSGGGPLALTEAAVASALSRAWLEETVRELELVANAGDAPTAAMREVNLVDLLEKKLRIKLEVDEVLLELSWPDREVAVEVLHKAQTQLLAYRRKVELTPLEERERALAAALELAREQATSSARRMQALVQSKRKGSKSSTVRGLQAEGRWGELPDVRLIDLQQRIQQARTRHAEQEKAHLERLAQLHAVLTEQRAIYAQVHPLRRETEEKLKTLQGRGEELERLREQERALVAEYVRQGGRDGELAAAVGPLWPEELTRDDEVLSAERLRLTRELDHLSRLESEWTSVGTELSSKRASFPERYVVISPVRPPLTPAFPSLRLFLIAALTGGALLGVFAAISRDLWGGRIVEAHQIVKVTGLPVVAEVSRR